MCLSYSSFFIIVRDRGQFTSVPLTVSAMEKEFIHLVNKYLLTTNVRYLLNTQELDTLGLLEHCYHLMFPLAEKCSQGTLFPLNPGCGMQGGGLSKEGK